MSARDHQIDRIAHDMTAGRPGETFAARVMAPIHGAPQPGFTSRVMAQVDARPHPGATRALRPVLAAALTVAVLAVLWLPSRVILPAAPAPVLAVTSIGEPDVVMPGTRPVGPIGMPRPAVPARSTRMTAPVRAAAITPDADRPLYRIAQLEPPAGLAIPAIAFAPPAVTPLERPVALIVPGLRLEKEKP